MPPLRLCSHLHPQRNTRCAKYAPSSPSSHTVITSCFALLSIACQFTQMATTKEPATGASSFTLLHSSLPASHVHAAATAGRHGAYSTPRLLHHPAHPPASHPPASHPPASHSPASHSPPSRAFNTWSRYQCVELVQRYLPAACRVTSAKVKESRARSPIIAASV
jgi:hypothetical protein